MNPFDKRTASILFTILVFVALLVMAYEARLPIIAVVFALLFAYLLEPIVFRFQSWLGGSRAMGIVATYILLGIVVTAFLITAGPQIFRQVQHLGEQLPTLLENVGSGQIAEQIGSRRGWDISTQLRVQGLLRNHRDAITHLSETLGGWLTALVAELPWVFLIPILAIFFLKDKVHFGELSVGLVDGERERRFLHAVLVDLDQMLAAFIRTQVFLSALSVVAYTVFLLVIQFPYAFAIGAVAGVLEFIPLVGPLITAGLILGMAALTGYPHWIGIVTFLMVWRLIQDYVSSPYLMGRGLTLHPFAVIVGVLCGGQIAGLPGVFLSVPVMAAFRIIWTNGRIATGREVTSQS